ncbi:hypothetical protein AAC387_Pa06g2432 [Persea americana]
MVGPMRKKSPLDPSVPPQLPSPSTSTGRPPPQSASPTTFFTQPQPANPFPTFPAQPLPGSTKPAPTHLPDVTLPAVTLSAPSQNILCTPAPSPANTLVGNLTSSTLESSSTTSSLAPVHPAPTGISNFSHPRPSIPTPSLSIPRPATPAPPSTSSTSATSQNASTRKASPPSLNDLPYEVVSVILKKTPSPTIGILNPFSILDHCSFLDPALNPSIYGRNLQAFSEGNSSTELPPGFDIPSDLPTLPPVPNPSPGSAHPPAEHSSPCSTSKASDPPSLHNISPTSPLATTATTDILPPNTTNTGKPGKGKKFTSPTTSTGPITRVSGAKKTSPKPPPMLKVLCWNCRGIANHPTQHALANMIHKHSPDLIFISEPMTPFIPSISFNWNRLGFDTFHSNAPSDLARVALLSAKSELHEALSAQEIHWKQRSRINWLKRGEPNTKFFHQSAKARSTFNSIHHIFVNGTLAEDQATIQAYAVDFFSNLFKPHDSQPSPSLFQINSPKVVQLHAIAEVLSSLQSLLGSDVQL